MEDTLLSQKILRVQHDFPLRSRRECEETLEIVNGNVEQALDFLLNLGPRVPSGRGLKTPKHKACSTCSNGHVSIRIKPFANCTDPSRRFSVLTIKTAVKILSGSRDMNKSRLRERRKRGLAQRTQVQSMKKRL